MVDRSRLDGLFAGGSSGDEGTDPDRKWDLKPVYRALVAAYGWRYSEIDEMTLREAREIFDGWPDYPPVFLMLKGLVEGLAGRPTEPRPEISDQDVRALFPPPPKAITDADADEVSAGFLGRLPRLSRPDPELAKMKFTADFDAMRAKNLERRVELAKRKAANV